MINVYKYYLVTDSQYYSATPRFVADEDLARERGFSSLYAVPEAVAQALQQAGTTRGFKGVVHSLRLWLDFDSYADAERAGQRLEEMGYGFIAYDTGNRGLHFGIDRDHAPSHLLPAKDKAWAMEHFPEADHSIYTHLHLFRLPQTIHAKTGRPKRLVYTKVGKSLSLPPLQLTSSQPLQLREGAAKESIFTLERVMGNTLPAQNGERHDQMVRLIYALKDDAGLDKDTATWWVLEANKLHSEPKTLDEIEYAIRSIYG